MITRFEIGKVYACRSTCDYDCIFSARVVARTEKTVTFEEEHRGRYTCRPHLWRDVESVYPHGRFSMCPVFLADRTLEQVINPPTRAQQEKPTMKNETKKPAPVKGAEIAAKAAAIAKAKAAFTPPAKPAAKPTPTKAPAPAPAKPADKGKPTVEEVVKARAAKIGIDPRKVIVSTVEAPKAKPADNAKPATAPKPAPAPAKPAAPSDEETGRQWRDMAGRHAAEMAALGLTATPTKGVPCVRFVSGVCVPAAKAGEYRATFDRHRDERAKLRDNPATARGVYREELRTFKGDEIAALYSLGLPHIADEGGITVPVIRGNRALALAWRDALAAVAPGAVSQIVTVRALGKPKPAAEAKPATSPADKAKPAAAPQKAEKPPAQPAAPSKGKSTAPTATKPPQAAQRPADEKPKGLGMVAKIEAKADKPAKAAKPKK